MKGTGVINPSLQAHVAFDLQLFESVRYAELMVLNRCSDPKSKCRVFPWAAKTACPPFLGVPSSREVDFDIYRDLDKMASMEKEAMQYLYSSLRGLGATGDSTLVYDITATYLEGSSCLVAEYGYSPGGKPGHKQIKIALAITRDGFPFYWKVLRGNIGDGKTIPGLVNDLRTLFRIKNFTLIFDRGMFSGKNFRTIEVAMCSYITALPAASLRALDFPELVPLSGITEDMCFNLRCDLARARRSRSLALSRDKLRAILRDPQVDNVFSSRLDEVIIKTVSSNGETKEIRSFRAALEPRRERLGALERYDALYCITTDLPCDKISDEEATRAYRRKERIQDAFRTIKSDVKVRPVYVRQDKRVRGHVMVCVLAYLLEAFIEYRMRTHDSKLKRASDVLDTLSECTIDEYNIPGWREAVRNLTMLTQEQLQILKDLGLEDILSMKLIRPILTSTRYIPYDDLVDPSSLPQ